MLSPSGPCLKRSAPSIWSVDSGYRSGNSASNSLDDLLQLTDGALSSREIQSHEHVGLPGFWNSQNGSSFRNEPPVDPIVTKVSVLTANDPSGNGFLLPQFSKDGQSCFACEFLNETSPGENIKCENCRIPEIVEPASLRLDTSAPSIHAARQSKTKALCKLDTTPRCSACELSTLISPSGPSTCPSCSPHPDFLSPVSPISPCDRVKRSRAGRASKLPLTALNRLQAWLDANHDDPYPNGETKRLLAHECGITEKQVTTWFTNARARQLNPLESYLSSGSEDEGAHESDIASAADQPVYAGGFTFMSDNNRAPGHRRAGSVVSGSSAFSSSQTRPQPSRRGKKKVYRRNNHGQPSQSDITLTSPVQDLKENIQHGDQEMWQCTFCRKHLVPKSWRRHEETQHLPRSQWTCMLYGPRVSIHRTNTTTSGTSVCAFCMLRDPPEDHFLTAHRISECTKRPITERTYYRPDHLRQHVKNFHAATLYDIVQSRWKRTPSKEEGNGGRGWDCGFCGVVLETWDKRETHIAAHFKEGRTMNEWQDCPFDQPQGKFKKSNDTKGKGKQKEHGHIRGLVRTFTGRSTRSSHSASQSLLPEPQPQSAFHTQPMAEPRPHHMYPNAFSQLPHTAGLGISELPALPNINMDPLLIDSGTAFADWCGTTAPFDPQYATMVPDAMSAYQPMDFDGQLNRILFGNEIDYHGPSNEPSGWDHHQ